MGRIACILVVDFPIAALVRANPALRDAPLAISHSLAPPAEIAMVSGRARACGVRAGMTIAQARSLIPDIAVMRASPAAERSARDALVDVAQSVSPLVEPGEGGSVWLDLQGLERLSGPENEIAAELVRRVVRVGMEGAVGIAVNKDLARLAARCGGVRIIEPGMEREFLDWLPLDVLGLDESGADRASAGVEATLARWGIRRLGELAQLPTDAVATRLGRYGVELVRLARGEEGAPLIARHGAETFAEEIELDYEIENLEALGFVMRPMLDRLLERLDLRGFTAGDIALSLGLGGRRKLERRVSIGAPSLDARACLALITLDLEVSPPDAAVESIRIEIEPRVARAAQADLFLPPSPAPGRLETTLARLAALCGPENVGTLRPENSHRPEALRLDRFAPPPPAPAPFPASGIAAGQRLLASAGLVPTAAPDRGDSRLARSWNGAGTGSTVAGNGTEENGADAMETATAVRLVIRAVRPPLEVEVLLSGGMPEFVRGPNIGARVVSIAGPWRRDGEWWHSPSQDGGDRERFWSEDAAQLTRHAPLPQGEASHGFAGFRRDYYELALADGGIYRVFRDLNSQKWFVDGMYD